MKSTHLLSLLCASFIWLGATCRAEPLLVKRQVVDAEGKPAANVSVEVWTLNKNRSGRAHYELKTGVDGFFSIEADVENANNVSPVTPPGFIIVDAPGYVVTLEVFTNWMNMPPERAQQPLRLRPDAPIRGQVKDAQGNPFADAKISVVEREMTWNYVPFNIPRLGVSTPMLGTTSAADGSFSLRRIWLEELGSDGGLSLGLKLAARAQRDGKIWSGMNEVRYPISESFANQKETTTNFIMRPTHTVRGQVVNASTKQPVPAVRVHLTGESYTEIQQLSPVTTDATGNWQIEGVPSSPVLLAIFAKEGFASDWQPIAEEGQNAGMALRPLVPIAGTILDDGGKPVGAGVSIMAIHTESFDDGRVGFTPIWQETKTDAKGQFAFKVAAGANHFRVRGQGLWEGGRISPLDMEVPAAGLRDVKWQLRPEGK